MIPLPTLSDSIHPIRTALDGASSEQRVNWMRGLGRSELRALYGLATGSAVPMSMLSGGEGEIVIHEGQNSLPAFTRFQKRFVLRNGAVQGYNHNSTMVSWVSGPGHFTCELEGPEILVNYIRMPPDVPSEFPPLIDNTSGTRSLVFGDLIDRLWRVSRHCTIGAAVKKGKPFPAWFMLTRIGDPPADG